MRAKSPPARTLLARMMERSELRLTEAAQFEEGYARQAATRVLESPQSFRDWEIAHSQIMAPIAGEQRLDRQARAVRRMALSMVHRKAPFEFLRDRNVCGRDRHRFFDVIFGEGDFARAMVREHQTYLVSFCSFLCVERFCAPSSVNGILEYERAYTSYWQAHANYRMGLRGDIERDVSLIQYLRDDVELARRRVLETTPSKADELTLEELRRPTGDTVRTRRPFSLGELR